MCNALRLKIPFLILIKNATIFYQYPNYIAIDCKTERDFLFILAPQLITNVAVVIAADRHIFILNQAFLDA